MYWIALPLAFLPAILHWWWTRSAFEPSASAVLPERNLAIAQRVSFVAMMCMTAIVTISGWHAVWLLPVQFVALTSSTYRARRALFGETWPFHRYLSWRVRFHAAMFGLWWFVALASALVLTLASAPARWWLTALTATIALVWHHWSGRVLLVLLGASRLERPDLDAHFQRVFAAARVPMPELWRAGAVGGRLANAFALLTLRQQGVLFFDSLLDQLTPDEITAILAHEVAHLEQFHRRRLLVIYTVTTVLMLALMIGAAVVQAVAPGFEASVWATTLAAAFGALWLRARRMQAHETDADLRAIELCGDPDALIRALTRIYEINHIPRRWSAMAEERATHPSLARRIRAIRDRTAATHAPPAPIERLIVASAEPGRCAVIDHNRLGFLWVDGLSLRSQAEADGDAADILERASRVEMIAYDQLRELRLSARRGSIELVAVGRHAGRWSMPIQDADAAHVQAALDRVDHLVVASAPARDLGIVRRLAVLLVVLLAAPYNAIGAVLAPALLALRRPKRAIMMALAAALAGTAVASVNDPDAGIVRFVLLTILTAIVLWSMRRPPQQDEPDAPLWIWIERAALVTPVLVGIVFAAASGRDLFGLHSAIRDRAWFTAALAAIAVFCIVESGRRTTRRAGFGVALLATASLVIGSPWFLLHAVADPLVAVMPAFDERTVSVTTLAQQAVHGDFNSVQVTPGGNQFVLAGEFEEAVEYDDEASSAPQPLRFVAGGFDGWSREFRALDVAVIDDERLLVLERARGSSNLRTEEIRTGRTLWTLTLPDVDLSTVHASPDGRWRAFGHRGRQMNRVEGRVGAATVASTRWTVAADTHAYLDVPRNDGGGAALAIASVWEEPTLTWALADWRETKRLLRVDATTTTEIATSHLRVECPEAPIDATGSVCVSFDGRSSRFWRVDLASGTLHPAGESTHMLWHVWQTSQHRLAAISQGRPLLIDLDSRRAITLKSDEPCWAQDIGTSKEVVVAMCNDGSTTTVRQHRLPAGS